MGYFLGKVKADDLILAGGLFVQLELEDDL